MNRFSFRHITRLPGALMASLILLTPALSQPIGTDWQDIASFFVKPDLKIVSVRASPGPYRVGQRVTLTVAVANNGRRAARIFVTSLRHDARGNVQRDLSSALRINPGETALASIPVTLETRFIRDNEYRNSVFLIDPESREEGLFGPLWRDGNADDNTMEVRLDVPLFRARIDVTSWFSRYRDVSDRNFACSIGQGLDTHAIAPLRPEGIDVGYISISERGAGPFPCVRNRLYETQPYAHFSLDALPDDARIIRALLRFTETNPRVNPLTRRPGIPTVQMIGRVTTEAIPFSGRMAVQRVRDVPADNLSVPVSGSNTRRYVDISHWVRRWIDRGRIDPVAFIAYPTVAYRGLGAPRRVNASGIVSLENVFIDILYD